MAMTPMAIAVQISRMESTSPTETKNSRTQILFVFDSVMYTLRTYEVTLQSALYDNARNYT
jgi:hypothetical protein